MEEGMFKLSLLASILGCKVLIIRRQVMENIPDIRGSLKNSQNFSILLN